MIHDCWPEYSRTVCSFFMSIAALYTKPSSLNHDPHLLRLIIYPWSSSNPVDTESAGHYRRNRTSDYTSAFGIGAIVALKQVLKIRGFSFSP